jgi:hypothetical protein
MERGRFYALGRDLWRVNGEKGEGLAREVSHLADNMHAWEWDYILDCTGKDGVQAKWERRVHCVICGGDLHIGN